jgi:hypothetical protein
MADSIPSVVAMASARTAVGRIPQWCPGRGWLNPVSEPERGESPFTRYGEFEFTTLHALFLTLVLRPALERS